MKHETVKGFLRRKQINISVQTYLIDALGAMAFGLFASLLIGTIFGTLGEKTGIEIFNTIAVYAKGATGAALGVSISYALKSPQLVIFSAATVGIAGNELGGPVGALAASIVASELGKLVSKETRVDILVTPGVTIISGVLTAQFVGPGVSAFMTGFGDLVNCLLYTSLGGAQKVFLSFNCHSYAFPGLPNRRIALTRPKSSSFLAII